MFRSFALKALSFCLAQIIVLTFLTFSALASPAPSGTRIVNIAIATYFNEALGITETVQSNQVEALVAAVPALEVEGHSELWLTRGARDQHHFTIHNIGNVALETRIDLDLNAENKLLRRPRLIRDLNANGLEDADEPELTPEDVLSLDIGARAHLIYSFEVDAAATPGQTATSELQVNAASPSDPSKKILGTLTANGLVTIVKGSFEIDKSVARRSTSDGELLTYTLRLRNNSENEIAAYDNIEGDTLRIDGNTRAGVLVVDPVPLNTRFAASRDAGGLEAIYQLRGAEPQSYTTQLPTDLSRVETVGFFWSGNYPVGKSSDLKFDVLVPAGLGDVTIRNTGWAYFNQGGGIDSALSNEVVLAYSAADPALLTFVDPTNQNPVTHGALGTDTGLSIRAGACNTSAARDTVEITVWSLFTGDTETLTARETGPNTGLFTTGPVPLSQMPAPISGDGVLASAEGDTLQAMTDCAGSILIADLLVNPGNFVFNSVTNAPVQNAEVTLYNASGAVAAIAKTDQSGFFSLGEAPAGSYRLGLSLPGTFAFASVRRSFEGFGRNVDNNAAYGQVFIHDGGVFHQTDIPVDPAYGIPVALEKSADKSSVMTGEPVVYTLTAHNNMDQALMFAEITDRPPYGADLIPGSVSLEGVTLPDPTRDEYGDFLFDIGTLRPMETKVLTYVMRYSPAARQGRNYNTAVLSGRQAGTGQIRTSTSVSTFVKLDDSGGVFAREATLIGSVFMDCDGDGLRGGADEPGVPGVKIVTQEGLFVVTDIDGKYSLFGLSPKSHALALMSRTLPSGTKAKVTRTTDLMRGGSRLVDLKRGELRDEPFALEACTPEAMAEVTERIKNFAERGDANSLMLSDMPIKASRPDVRSVRSEAGIATSSQILTGKVSPGAAPAKDLARKAAARSEVRAPLESLIRNLTPELAFIGLPENSRTRRNTLTLRVKGPADLDLALNVNGTELSASRVGEKSVWAKGNIQALEFVAVKLQPGQNSFVLTGKDPFGIERARKTVTLTAPGQPARIEIVAPKTASASAGTVVPVVVRFLDASGRPVPTSGTVTLRAHRSEWDVTDIREDQPGVQAFVDNGEASFGLIAPQITGHETIEISSNFGKAKARINFTADLDERIMVGVIEGAVALKGRGDLIANDRISPFENTATGLRGEVYLKGRIRGDALLTLRYSSDRDTEDRLFRDIRGDEYYPVYGDNSERGFDAQSSSNLYIKVEKGNGYVLYGDIAVEPESEAFQLGGYSRVTTGAKAGWQNDRVSVSVFAAHTAEGQRIVEFPSRGVSGPYDLDLSDYREGSDRVEILVRDRDTGAILSEQPQRRLTHYTLDYFRNALIFNAPVPQADFDGNPISIRVTYEATVDGGERYWLYGGEVNFQVTDKTRIGARVVHADAQRMGAERERIHAAYLQTRLDERTMLELEAAQAENGKGDTGSAVRVLLTREDERSRLEVEAVLTDRNFDPTGAPTRVGTNRLSIDYQRELKNGNRLTSELDYINDRIARTETLRARVGLERQINEHLRFRTGLELDHDLKGDVATALRLNHGSDWSVPSDPRIQFRIDTRQTLIGEVDNSLTIGADYQFSPKVTLVGEAEFEPGKQEDQLSRFRFGLEYQINDWLSGRSEVNGEDTVGMNTRFIQGLQADWQIDEQLSLAVGLEHSRAFGETNENLTSLSIGSEWLSKDDRWIVQADLDQTFESAGNTLYANLGVAGRVSPDTTFLARSRYARDDRSEGLERHRTRVGLSYRPVEDPRLAVLAWYEHRMDKSTVRSSSHMWSVDASYQASDRLNINGKYAGIAQRIDLSGGASDTTVTQLVQGGMTYDFADNRLRLGLNAMRFWDDGGTTTNAFGAELGYVLGKGSLVSLGYNKSMGQRPNDTTLYQEGAFLRIRLLLDDSLWDRLQGFGAR